MRVQSLGAPDGKLPGDADSKLLTLTLSPSAEAASCSHPHPNTHPFSFENYGIHSSTLAWKIPWTQGPGGLSPMGTD